MWGSPYKKEITGQISTQEEQELQEDDVKSYMPSGDDLPPPRKALDDELLVTIEMLMEAYSSLAEMLKN